MTTPAPLVRAQAVGQRFRDTQALDGVDLDLAAGESVALLGPNGAGKTTLLRILAGVDRPASGEVTWQDATATVGWVPQRPAVYPKLTVRENLRLFVRLGAASDTAVGVEELLGHADLAEVADRPARHLSTGTLQRLNIACALAGRPRALLLDEPTSTLSPDQRLRLWEWIAAMRREQGMAVLFSTQSVGEAARNSDRCVVVVDGHPVFNGPVATLADGVDPEVAFLRLVEGAR